MTEIEECVHRTQMCPLPAKVRPNKKNMCVYGHMSKKSMVGRSALNFFFYYRKNRKYLFPVPESDISFSKFPVSRHFLKLFYDELCSFSTFFALNFDKKLAVE